MTGSVKSGTEASRLQLDGRQSNKVGIGKAR
jgi:hypothetical protein